MSSSTIAPPIVDPPTPKELRKVAAAAYIGTALEWYDFFLFGTTASIVFAPLFFTGDDPALSTLGAFLSFGVGFVARPIGAVIFGHIGDRYGRRGALVITIALMGIATALMGALPTYETAGIVAPILLTILRAVQGIATGGEWGGATLLAIEYAPMKKRGLYAAIVQLGSPSGTLLSAGAIALVAALPGDAFLEWAWRLPYLASIVLVLVALWLRWRVEETPVFRQLMSQDKQERLPVVEVVRTIPGRLVIGIAAYLFNNAGFFILTTFMISYVTRVLELPASTILNALTIGAVAQLVVTVFSGLVADRIGSAQTVAIGYAVCLAAAFPIFMLVDTRSTGLITLAMVLALGLGAIPYAPIGALLSKLFPPRLHYSGLGLSANLAGLIAGFMPALATWILTRSDDQSWGPASLLALIAFVSLVGSIVAMRVIKADDVALEAERNA